MPWFKRKPAITAPVLDGETLVRRLDLFVEALCPCGSQITHQLALHSVIDCPRCGRAFAILSVEYERAPGPDKLPDVHVWVGYVAKRESPRRPTAHVGVH